MDFGSESQETVWAVDVQVESRPSELPLVEQMWRSQSQEGGSFTSLAATQMEMVVTKQVDRIYFTLRGPETKATPAPVPENAEFFGIIFKLGTYVPAVPIANLVDHSIDLPEANSNSFWLHGSAWEFPTFENADTFIERLVREGLLAHEPLVQAAIQGQELRDLSLRSVQRRFLNATGLTQKSVHQIERARKALALLRNGVSILDTTYEVGYFDQSHLTNSLKYFVGQTPSQVFLSQPDE